MRPLVYNKSDWEPIWQRIKKDYPPSVYLIRSKMRQELGFTVREHSYYDGETLFYRREIHLDFWDEKHRSLFLLKYANCK